MSTQRYYKYFAFISYSRRDEKFAQRLQKFLMGYKLPTKLCKQYPDRPKNLRPIYRDKTDLGVDNLNKGLSGGLELSKYLIVVCSVNSARPNREGKNWINEEVRTFVGLEEGNADRVIPVMLRQKGDGSTSKDCTPGAVQELHMLAADVSDKGEERAFSDVAAKMLDLAPNDLWDWWGREQRKKRIVRRTLGGIAAAVVLGIIAGLWYAGVPHYKYYRDYVEYNNLPHGIGELSETERAETHGCYRFMWQHLRLSKVECVTCSGNVLSADDNDISPSRRGKPLVILLDTEKGTKKDSKESVVRNVQKTLRNLFTQGRDVRRQMYCSGGGDPVRILEFSRVQNRLTDEQNDSTIQFRELNGGRAGFAGSAQLIDDVREPIEASKKREKERVRGMLIWRNSMGAIVKEVYSDAYGFPVMDADGVWGHLYEWEKIAGENRVVAVTNLAKGGGDRMVEAPSFSGILRTRYEYDERGRIISESYLGEDGSKMVCNKEDVAQKRYDWVGSNVERETYYDGEGNRTCCKDGYSGVRREYRHGLLKRAQYIGVNDEPCTHKRFRMAEGRFDFTPSGEFGTVSYFGTNGEPVCCVYGYSKVERKTEYIGECKTIQQKFYDTKGEPCRNIDGIYTEVMEIERGRLRRLVFYGLDGKRDNCNQDFAELKVDYDGENMISLCYYGKKGETEKVMNNKYGVAELRFKYSKYGVEERKALDTNGERCMRREGFCIERIKYDAEGNRAEVSYYDDHDKPCRIRLGENYFHIVRFHYVDGRLKKEVFLNERCETDLDSITEREYEYDDRGREKFITITYVDDTGKIIKSRQVQERNSLGQVTHTTYVDAVGHPCEGPEGAVSIVRDYDENGNEAVVTYEDANGKPCASGNGVAKIITRTDAVTGLQIREMYDMQKRLLVIHKFKDGKVVEEYDNGTGVTNKIEYGADGYRTRWYAHDKEGQLLFRALYGTRDRISSFFAYDPATGQRKEEYRNDKGETMEQKVISRDGNVLQRTVFSGGRRDYSEGYDPATGQRMKVRYDADGKPAELVVTAKNGEILRHVIYSNGKKK